MHIVSGRAYVSIIEICDSLSLSLSLLHSLLSVVKVTAEQVANYP